MFKYVAFGSIVVLLAILTPHAQPQQTTSGAAHAGQLFQTSSECLACHNNLTSASGEDISIGADWRASMMAHSSRDPYWQASVRREVIDHPSAGPEIEDECAICHMPMARTQANASGAPGKIFDHLPIGQKTSAENLQAADGVSCTMCHQITNEKFGTKESFTGGYVIDRTKPPEERQIFGRFKIDEGRTMIMNSSTGFVPTESMHVEQSELCATCHTLYTKALGPNGEVLGELPEQVMYLEWRHSGFREERSCQSCHMPVLQEETPIASVFGELRKGFARHVFQGGNFFMLRMLNRYRADLGVVARSADLTASANRTVHFLQNETATVSIRNAAVSNGRLDMDVAVESLTGHKLPTGYPSRRVWLRLTVLDQAGRKVFESGAITPRGLIEGNDNDADPARFEPHYTEIRQADQVQVYESIMGDVRGAVTTGLLTATKFLKDNRLLPRGFDKGTAEPDIAVIGEAAQDRDFVGARDVVRYSIDLAGAGGPFRIEAQLLYQPISFRWAENLRRYTSPETNRFVSYYESMSAASSEVIARASALIGM